MSKNIKRTLPIWFFAILAICGLLTSGIYIGIISAQGLTTTHLIKSAAFGAFGLVMFWGALSSRKHASK
jgi:hypothetical protein